MSRLKEICASDNCTGCGLCVNICPAHAISLESDSLFGHKRPVINAEKCIECGICERKCPINLPVKRNETKKTFAAWQVDEKKHNSSSSGGIASALYEKCLCDGGWIAGVYTSEDFEPRFKLTNDPSDIQLFKGSKYVQVDTNNIYNEVFNKLKQGKKVVFVGLPCQCAAMKQRAGEQEHLLLVDMVCHGVPSFQTLKKHIEYIEQKKNKNAKKIRFRDSVTGEVLLLLLPDGEVLYKRNLHEDVYMHSFISGDLFAENCYRCQYACPDRVGDLTICDFWGLGAKIPFEYKKSGVSAVLVNTEKGKAALDAIADDVFMVERPTQEAIDGNSQLVAPSAKGFNHDKLLSSAVDGTLEDMLIKIYGNMTESRYRKRRIMDLLKTCGKKIGLDKLIKRR